MQSTTSPPLALEAHGLSRRFGDVLAVDGIDLELPTGTVTGVLGPNGSGKSTFLRILIGLVRPDGGRAVVAGVQLAGDGVEVRRRVTFAPGEIALYGELSATEQLRMLLRGRSRAAHGRATAVAERLGLPLKKRVHEYSHGMKRQLLFAAAMGPDVALRILDEPTEGLDPAKRSQVLELIAEESARGTTILLSSHHLSEVEEVCDRLVFFSRGKLLADEDPEELRRLAAKSARLEYASSDDASTAAALFEAAPLVSAAHQDRRVVRLELVGEGSPMELFAKLAGLEAELPHPVNIELGRLSLTDLYERVYGVRGL